MGVEVDVLLLGLLDRLMELAQRQTQLEFTQQHVTAALIALFAANDCLEGPLAWIEIQGSTPFLVVGCMLRRRITAKRHTPRTWMQCKEAAKYGASCIEIQRASTGTADTAMRQEQFYKTGFARLVEVRCVVCVDVLGVSTWLCATPPLGSLRCLLSSLAAEAQKNRTRV